MIKGVAFDLEGTVVNVENLHFQAFVLAAAEAGLSLIFESIVEKIPHALGGGDKRISQGIYDLSDRKMSTMEILDRKRYYYERSLEKLESIEPRLGFKEVFSQIRKMGLNVAIGSLTPVKYAEILLRRSGLDRLFPPENVVLEKDVRALKPAPDVYLETARRLAISPSEQLVFEDSATGLIAARSAGSVAVVLPVYHFSKNLVEIIEAGAARIFWDWREINMEALIANLNQKEGGSR